MVLRLLNSASTLKDAEQEFASSCDSPDLSVGGWSLSDDGAGLWRRQRLLDHYAGVVVAHP